MPIDFVAVDFETANFSRASACAVGLARVKSGQVVEQTEWLIDPPGGPYFTNSYIHGVEAHHVVGAPTWAETLQRIEHFVDGGDLVAYSGFDPGVYNAANILLGIDRPDFVWRNALTLVKRLYPHDQHRLDDHRLPTMVEFFGLGDFDHHRASADAAMCGRVVAHIADAHRVDDVAALWPVRRSGDSRSERVRTYRPNAPLPPRNEHADPNHPLFGEVVCFSGDLAGFGRKEAQRIVADFGATVGSSVTKKTSLVVMGGFDPRTLRAGASLSSKVERALQLRSVGQRVEILDEAAFIELINLDINDYS